MHHLILAFAEWIQNTAVALLIAKSRWVYPFVQLTHFTGLAIWLGTGIAVDLHLLGAVKKSQTAAELVEATVIWNWLGLGIAALGGLMLFSTAATTFIINPAFEVKTGALLPVALIWHVVVQIKARTWGKSANAPNVAKVAGLVEILLWVCTATAAVAIPYF